MTGYQIYIFILCLLVFSALTGVLSLMLARILKLTVNSIKHGLEDECIKIEYQKEQSVRPGASFCTHALSVIVLSVLFVLLVLLIATQLSGGRATGNIPLPRAVLSSSMSRPLESNQYLAQNNLTDQFNQFDLIFTYKLPDEFDLQLYDVVVYEYDGKLIVHRIVGIEEPNEAHPEHRHFLLRGDAVRYSDEFPVLYSQMKAIYTGDRIPFVGSFFTFMQSPAGYLCILLLVFAMIATPIVEKRLATVKRERLILEN